VVWQAKASRTHPGRPPVVEAGILLVSAEAVLMQRVMHVRTVPGPPLGPSAYEPVRSNGVAAVISSG
jgi:hypothetical protein